MGKVFTITEGLENMGAIRTGGQGSVYKGRRVGEIITAVKLLPTPIHTEDENDKNYRDFINEVNKLKKVNESPNPNVVKILSSGLTESGSFPYIEMEFIEGPDLQELLEAPNDPVFKLSEVAKVADQLSNALAHCHRHGIKHGDIKSNNVKFNVHTGNYVLLDFGLAIMSDEERRTSLRRAGAIEFMAPEQNEGQMLFQSDIYSFGVILFELLAGRVPFPLNNKGETERNKVMLAHMESTVPDVLDLRRQNIPKTWDSHQVNREMQVPEWLLKMIARCLSKNPGERFRNGDELHEAIALARISEAGDREIADNRNDSLLRENETLKAEISRLRIETEQLAAGSITGGSIPRESGIRFSKGSFIGLMVLLIGLIAFLAYAAYLKPDPGIESQGGRYSTLDTLTSADSLETEQERVARDEAERKNEMNEKINAMIDSTLKSDTSGRDPEPAAEDLETGNGSASETDISPVPESVESAPKQAKYTLSANRAFFYENPDEASKTNNFLSAGNRTELTAVDDKNGFIYVVFFTNTGQVTRGWLRKRDLRRVG